MTVIIFVGLGELMGYFGGIQVAQKKVKIAFENADSSSRVELIPSKIKKICPIFILRFYKFVRPIRNLNGTLFIAFVIQNVELTLRLEEFACILRIPCRGVCVFTSEWAISSLPNGVDSNLDIYPPPYEDSLLIRDALFNPIPPDHVMIPLSESKVFMIMPIGKRPRLPTPTSIPSRSSKSNSSSSHQKEENDLINNFMLDLIPYINQLPPIEGEESLEFKQTKGMFKCLGHFLSNLGKKKK
nr:hypothetical protein [Tanacetum cinerariifolium]